MSNDMHTFCNAWKSDIRNIKLRHYVNIADKSSSRISPEEERIRSICSELPPETPRLVVQAVKSP